MHEHKLIITPKTKVGEMLDSYPPLEEVLLRLSPAFAKLKNPVLRKTVARVATLQQAAVIGKMKTDDLINTLRREIGQGDFTETGEEGNYFSDKLPEGFPEKNIAIRFDAVRAINSGESPMSDILSKSHQLKEGDIMELRTPFLPVPIIDMLKNKGYSVVSIQKSPEEIFTYIQHSG